MKFLTYKSKSPEENHVEHYIRFKMLKGVTTMEEKFKRL